MPSAQDIFNSYLSNAGATTSPVAATPTAQLDPNLSPAQAQVASTVPGKQADVAAAAQAKQAELAANTTSPAQAYTDALTRISRQGLNTVPTQRDADLINLSPSDLIAKYGSAEGLNMINDQLTGSGMVQQQQNQTRTGLQVAGDVATGVGLGVANTLGGLGALGLGGLSSLGVVGPGAGVAAANGVQSLNDYVQNNLQSAPLQAHRSLVDAEDQLGYRDNQASADALAPTNGSFVAGLAKIGRDAGTAVGNTVSDPTLLSDGIAQGIGSLVSAGPVGKVIGVGAEALTPTARIAGLLAKGTSDLAAGTTSAASMLAEAAANPTVQHIGHYLGEEGPILASIGSTEAGGAYQQNAAGVANISFDDLAKNSPMFNQLVANGMSQDDARTQVANRSGLIAAAIQGPLATATGAIAAKFEAHPFSVPSLREAGQNILKEGVEETLQSGGGQLAQNYATQQTSDQNQDLTDGVGEQAGLGGLYGLTSAGIVQAPGAVTHAAVQTGKAAVGAVTNLAGPALKVAGNVAATVAQPVIDLAAKRGDKVAADNESSSPVSDQSVAQTSDAVAESIPASVQKAMDDIDADPKTDAGTKENLKQYVQDSAQFINFSPDEVTSQANAPEVVKQAAEGQTTRIGFFQSLAAAAKDADNSSQDRILAKGTLINSINSIDNALQSVPGAFDSLPEDHPAKQLIGQIQDLVNTFKQSPAGETVDPKKSATENAQLAKDVSQTPITEDSVNTPEGMKDIQAHIAAAELSPQNSSPEANDLIMKMATAGTIQLDPGQRAALQSARALIEGRKTYINELSKTQSPEDTRVAREVSFNPEAEGGGGTLLDHANNVRSAIAKGDIAGATEALNHLGMFAQSQQNKVGAVNDQLETNGPNSNKTNSLHYQTVQQDKSGFRKSDNPFGVTPRSIASVGKVQEVAAEAHALTAVHNALATAYPKLGVKQIEQTALHPSIANASPEQVAKEFKEGTRTVERVERVEPVQPVETKTTIQPEPKEEVAPAPEEKQVVTEPVVEKTPLQPTDSKKEKVGTIPVEPVATTEPVEEKKGIATVYPNLVTPESGNQFTKAFKLPAEVRSNLAGEETPLAKVKAGITTGTSNKFSDEVRRVYRNYLSTVPLMVDTINERLNTFMNKPATIKAIDGGSDPTRWKNGKLLNLAEEQEDGSFKLNQGLVETAAIAGLQWMLSSNQYGADLDAESASHVFGLDQNSPAIPTMINLASQGILRLDAVTSLAQKIQNYWGLQTNRDALDGYTVGIPQAMAIEVLKSLMAQDVKVFDEDSNRYIDAPMIKETQYRIDSNTGEVLADGESAQGRTIKTVSVMEPARFKGMSTLNEYPDAIEKMVSKTPDLTHYLGGDRPEVPATQMRNPIVDNTPEQKDMIANETDTVHRINQPIVDLYHALTSKGLVNIFGPGELDEEKMNVNDFNSKSGQRLSVTAALNVLDDTLNAVEAHASENGQDVGDVDIRYGYNMSRVGRLQMLGRFNPQASKLMREAVLPTQSTLDLSKASGDHMKAFMLAVGQAIGVKVHNMQYGGVLDKLFGKDGQPGLLNGSMQPAIDLLNQFANTGKINADELKTTLGANPTFVQLHALSEYARYRSLVDSDDHESLKAFQTKLYLEADGRTNGIVNGMQLLSIGSFDPTWVRNMSRGGLYFGGTDDQNSGVQYERDPTDLYKAVSDDMRSGVTTMRQSMDNDDPVKIQQTHLLNLMNLMLGDVVKFDGGDNVDLDRGITKNPATITLYGSGANGIAGNLTDMLIQKIYQQFTDTLQSGRKANELFGTAPDAEARFNTFFEAMDALTSKKVTGNQQEGLSLSDSGTKLENQNPKDWTFSGSELNAIRQNMRTLFVDPMRESIQNVVGASLFRSAEMVRKATQVQSIFLQYAYQKAIDDAIEARTKNDPGYYAGEGLSQTEQDRIQRSLSPLAPLIHAPGQTFYVAGSTKSQLKGNGGYAESLTGDMEVPAVRNQPGNSGVAGIPFLNIGMGDGKTMQLISTMRDAIAGTLKIFDGMHMPLDKITEGSQQANEAVLKSWMGNPLKAVSDSFSKFLTNASTKDIEPDSPQHKALVEALFGLGSKTSEYPLNKVDAAMQILNANAKQGALEVEARHRALAQVNVSVDQMAAASAPFQVNNKEMLTGSNEQIANRLNEIQREELAKLTQSVAEKPFIDIKNVGTADTSGVQVLSSADINTLPDQLKLKLTIPEKKLLSSIQQSMAALGYKIIAGTREQLSAYNDAQGANGIDSSYLSDTNNQGLTIPGRQQIYLINPTKETLIHELIHAATLDTVQKYYNGDVVPNHGVVDSAIRNLEGLMDQFTSLGSKVEDLPQAVQDSYNNALTAIQEYQNNTDLDEASRKSQALNEYMAWGLSNQKLGALQKSITVHPLVQMVKEVVQFVKNIVWGNKTAPKSPGEDMLSNLQFNTEVLLHSQPTVSSTMRDTVMMQSTPYGNNDRLTNIDDALDRKITDYIDVPDPLTGSRRQTEVMQAINLGAQMTTAFASAFPMNMQEQTTFSKIMGSLATEMQLDPNAMARTQEVWAQVTKQLKVEHFLLGNPEDLSVMGDMDRGQAQDKYSALMGTTTLQIDGTGRSTLLPAFLALAVTNDQFRNVLSNMEMPKTVKSGADSRVDAFLEDSANVILDSLSKRVSGEGKAANIRDAMDALANRMTDIAQDRENYMDQFLATSGGLVDFSNTYVTQAFDALSKFVTGKAEDLNVKYGNKLTNLLAQTSRVMSAVINEQDAGKVSEGVLSWLNRVKGNKPFTDLVTDLIGRTDSNAEAWDMIKTVRAMISKMRQQFRDQVPGIINDHFSRELTDEEQSLLHRGLGKADVASLAQGMKQSDILNLLNDSKVRNTKIAELENAIKTADPRNWPLLDKKMKQLANFMMGGKPLSNLLRNSVAISKLLGEPGAKKTTDLPRDFVKNIDMLTTLHALGTLTASDHLTLGTLASKESDGMKFALSYLQGQRIEETNRAVESDAALFNHYKGYIPSLQQAGASMIIADDSQYARLKEKSYTRVANYEGSSAETNRLKRGYYFANVSGHAPYLQGIFQNVRQTAGGVDVANGHTIDNQAGRITDPRAVARAEMAMRAGNETGNERLMPVYDSNGKVVAMERSVDPVQMQKLQYNTNLSQMIGVWRGRQVEESMAAIYNDQLIDKLHNMYEKDMMDSTSNRDQYVNVFSAAEQARDPVLRDAMKLVTPQMKQQIKDTFGNNFFVRRDMLENSLGYRAASVGDAWTGTSRWSDQTQDNIKRLAMSVFGNKAYQVLVNSEKTWQNFVGDVKTMILVKSLVVPVSNLIGNGLQLVGRGVPIKNIIVGMPKKTAEIQSYVASEVRRIQADAELRAAQGRNDVVAQRKLGMEIQSIEDGHKYLSIWPLIKAGEFSAISDGKAGVDDIELTSGKLHSYIEGLVNKLPDSVKTAGRYALITKDTALFQGMQKATEYGDFLAKAILYDDLTKRQGKSSEYALSKITEEYVNYDRLPGRFRGYLDSMGLMWFMNFKIRSTKTALSMIRNNPVHALLAGLAPVPSFLGSPGLPTSDNLFTKLADGKLAYSLGFGQIFHAPMLNPWVHMTQ